ncbi:TlpA family protein disulfide reductase [Herbiconiux liangxiaofengii]|uniref:TlpA family protein disulfide reductase n=1 Tax=Herbiconiux liangxiaofengii TaxID=3342795 RepID=UPI0035B7DA45
MNPLLAIAVLLSLVAATTLVGLLWRSRQGAARAVATRPAALDLASPGARATLVQFSTEFCSGCPGTRRVLQELASRLDGVAHLDVDVTHRADLVRRFSILQTPTTLILDRDGIVRTRIGGVVRRGVIERRLEELA